MSIHQSGNKKHHSTETLNILVSDFMLEDMDKKMLSTLILLDWSKAFDSVSYPILLHKLSSVGACPDTLKWFKSYLNGRSQSVRIGSTVSLPHSHHSWCPSGCNTITSVILHLHSEWSFCSYTVWRVCINCRVPTRRNLVLAGLINSWFSQHHLATLWRSSSKFWSGLLVPYL